MPVNFVAIAVCLDVRCYHNIRFLKNDKPSTKDKRRNLRNVVVNFQRCVLGKNLKISKD